MKLDLDRKGVTLPGKGYLKLPQKKSSTRLAGAVSIALASMMLSASLNAGMISDTNALDPTVRGNFLGDCGVVGATTACVGAWNLGNVQVNLTRALDGSVFDTTFNETTGVYATMTLGDSFASMISNGSMR